MVDLINLKIHRMILYKTFDKLFGYLFFNSWKIYELRYFLHFIYFLLFKIKILKLPKTLIYDLNRYPTTFGDYIHVLSISQSMCLKFNKCNLEKIILIYDEKKHSHLKFLNTIGFGIKNLLDFKIKVIKIKSSYLNKGNYELGFSIYPYMPTFYFHGCTFRNHKPLDIPILAKKLDLRIFSCISINKLRAPKYKTILIELEKLIKSKYYCFVFREEKSIHNAQINSKNYSLEKSWDSKKTQSIIRNLIRKGEKVLIINPIGQKYKIDGAISFDQASDDILLRYFLYINAYQVLSVACGPCSLLLHSNCSRYLIYDTTEVCASFGLSYHKRNHFPLNKDYVIDTPSRKAKTGNIEINDIYR